MTASEALRVAVDAHAIGRRATGHETYVRGLLTGLARRTDIEPIALMDKGAVPASLIPIAAQLSHHDPASRLLFDLRNPRQRWKADLLHVQYVRPIACDTRLATTVYDISKHRAIERARSFTWDAARKRRRLPTELP